MSKSFFMMQVLTFEFPEFAISVGSGRLFHRGPAHFEHARLQRLSAFGALALDPVAGHVTHSRLRAERAIAMPVFALHGIHSGFAR